jgi:hypothetical protein
MITFLKPDYSSKGRFSNVGHLFHTEELSDLFEKGVRIEGADKGINSTWSVRAVANGDGTVKLKQYSREIKTNGSTVEIVEDENRNITHILIPVYSVIRDKAITDEFPYLAKLACIAKVPVSNVGNIFSFK